MIKYLQLQQYFDVKKMQEEVALLEGEFWKQHYNKKNYEGEWTVLPLRSINGATDNILSVHTSTDTINKYADTSLLESCPYIKSAIEFFNCERKSVRLMKLCAGSVIKEHSDMELSFEEGEVRIHIPVITNPNVEFYLEEERIPMQEGECWYLNLSLKHRVTNNGTTDRIHLVIDCKVNDWIEKLFAEKFVVQKLAEEENRSAYKQEDKLKIIQELRRMNTPVALQLAAQMEKELT